jgi:predicted ATPase/class 3 adenylate cyclase
VQCPSCGTENEAGRKFCPECGARLAAGCPSCGATNPAGAKFCADCGISLTLETASRPSSEGPEVVTERRIVSVLFADLVGFTTLAEGRDAEEVREVQDRYFATCRTVIERYGGTLEKFIGDAVMAVWGAPTSHEDDAERAVRAALDLVGAVAGIEVTTGGPGLEARAAVMTGEAAVSVGATDQGLVTGDLINTASRLQGVAPPGSVLIDEPTRRGSEAAIAAEAIGEQELRGRAAPVPAWRALRTLAMVGGRGRTERLEPPFVGRDAELRLLKDLLHAVDDEARARLVSVTGIAGIGKSRLVWELEKYIDGIVDDVYWHKGRSPAYGEGIAFWALAEMVRSRAGIAEGDDAETARTKLAAALEEYVPDEPERRDMAPWLLALLGFHDPGDGRQDEAFAAARRLLERIAERGLVVLVFEDLQWADTGLIQFIESILEWSRNHRILIITLARPELLERRPTWGAGQRNFTALHLDPLSDNAMAQLLDGVVPGLPSGFARRIVERAAGVPLFAVETVRMLIDDGRLVREDGRYRVEGDIRELAIPESLRGLIGARLDGLPPDDRALLQDAAVLGLTFTIDALVAVTGRPVDELEPRLRAIVRREILTLDEGPRSPERGQYAFVQGPIREVAYETLAKRERRARHLAAARYFETLDSDELAGILASHYLDAHRATPEGPEADALAAQARVALRGAAERAAGLGSYDLALGYLEKALTVTPDAIERAHAWEAAASAASHAAKSDVAERYARQALDWYLATGDPIGAARSVVLLTQPAFESGQTVEAIAVLDSTLAACAGSEDEPEVVRVVAELARALMTNNDPRALEVADRALVAAERLDAIPVIAEALVTKAAVLDTMGRRREGMAVLRGAIELAVTQRLTNTEFRARANYSYQLGLDDPRTSFAAALEVRELARKLGARDHFNWSTWLCYGGARDLGQWDRVLELTAEMEAGDPGPLELEGIHAMRAAVAAYRGDAETAARERALADRLTVDASRPDFIAGRQLDQAEILALAGRLPEAYDGAMTAARLVPNIWMTVAAARWAVWMGDLERTRAAVALLRGSSERGAYADALRNGVEAGLASLEGRRDDAIAGYRSAIATFRRLDLPLDLGRCQLEYATLLGPEAPGARAAADEAREIFERLDSAPLSERLETGLRRWETDATEVAETPRARRAAQPANAADRQEG